MKHKWLWKIYCLASGLAVLELYIYYPQKKVNNILLCKCDPNYSSLKSDIIIAGIVFVLISIIYIKNKIMILVDNELYCSWFLIRTTGWPFNVSTGWPIRCPTTCRIHRGNFLPRHYTFCSLISWPSSLNAYANAVASS